MVEQRVVKHKHKLKKLLLGLVIFSVAEATAQERPFTAPEVAGRQLEGRLSLPIIYNNEAKTLLFKYAIGEGQLLYLRDYNKNYWYGLLLATGNVTKGNSICSQEQPGLRYVVLGAEPNGHSTLKEGKGEICPTFEKASYEFDVRDLISSTIDGRKVAPVPSDTKLWVDRIVAQEFPVKIDPQRLTRDLLFEKYGFTSSAFCCVSCYGIQFCAGSVESACGTCSVASFRQE